MADSRFTLVGVHQLRKGMFIQLELGWIDHPFPVGSFKIVSEQQLQILRTLGSRMVRYYPSRSDVSAFEVPDGPDSDIGRQPDASQVASTADVITLDLTPEALERAQRRTQFEAQQKILRDCEARFNEASLQFDGMASQVLSSPEIARSLGEELVGGCLAELLTNGESVIRLLSEGVGEGSSTHAVNVMVISLLLGKALDMDDGQLSALGIAAVMHDLGKLELPEKPRFLQDHFSPAEVRQYQQHVALGVAIAQRMHLPTTVVDGIAQHHEYRDGTGFPLRLSGAGIGRVGSVLSLVNCFDNFCNPARSTVARTPHEALSTIFAQLKARFDPVVLGAFIKMMGVYPPGSVVQLINDRFAIVVSVNPARPLRPKLIVHDPRVPREEALVLDLEDMPELGVRRSLKPAQLPKAAMDYLSPRPRICYFFERAVDPGSKTAAKG